MYGKHIKLNESVSNSKFTVLRYSLELPSLVSLLRFPDALLALRLILKPLLGGSRSGLNILAGPEDLSGSGSKYARVHSAGES